MKLTESQRLDWLRLIRSDNVGPKTFRDLIHKFGGASAALEYLPIIAKKKTGRPIHIAALDDCKREMEAVYRKGARFVALGEADYPPLLRTIHNPPPLLTLQGNAGLLQTSTLALVGTRNPSTHGLYFTEKLCKDLGKEGFVIVSGLARGIDAKAHQISLRSGTIAVLAGGLDCIYPPENQKLAAQIAEKGLLITEMPLHWQPRARDFPRRNRLISGMSLGIIVMEATLRSGSLITARFALEQNRELFAVPGFPTDPRAEGPNELLRQGANFCTKARDILRVLGPIAGIEPLKFVADEEVWGQIPWPLWDEWDFTDLDLEGVESGTTGFEEPDVVPSFSPPPTPIFYESEEEEEFPPLDSLDPKQRLLTLLGPTPVSIDELIREAALPVSDVHIVLQELEWEGMLERHGNHLISLRAPLC